jgi:hypothetical protein
MASLRSRAGVAAGVGLPWPGAAVAAATALSRSAVAGGGIVRGAVLIYTLASGALAAEPAPPPPETVSVRLSLPPDEIDAVWLLPPGPALGLISVQHGFARRCDHLRGTLAALAQGGLIVLCLNAEMAGGNPLLADALAAAMRDGLMPPGRSEQALRWVVAGHSAGGLFASHLGAALAREAPGMLAGALLFDPVSGSGFADNLQAISQAGARPVRAISASASGCNAMNNAGPALAAVYQSTRSAGVQAFVGLQLVDRATHLDAEGEDTSALAVWACGQGPPRPDNVALLRTLAQAWARDMVLGGATPEVQRGGALVEQALAEGQAVPIE